MYAGLNVSVYCVGDSFVNSFDRPGESLLRDLVCECFHALSRTCVGKGSLLKGGLDDSP